MTQRYRIKHTDIEGTVDTPHPNLQPGYVIQLTTDAGTFYRIPGDLVEKVAPKIPAQPRGAANVRIGTAIYRRAGLSSVWYRLQRADTRVTQSPMQWAQLVEFARERGQSIELLGNVETLLDSAGNIPVKPSVTVTVSGVAGGGGGSGLGGAGGGIVGFGGNGLSRAAVREAASSVLRNYYYGL